MQTVETVQQMHHLERCCAPLMVLWGCARPALDLRPRQLQAGQAELLLMPPPQLLLLEGLVVGACRC